MTNADTDKREPHIDRDEGEMSAVHSGHRVRKGERQVMRNISREELKAKMDRGESFVLVDTLSAAHYQNSHLPGAMNLPYEFVDEAESLLPDKDADISFPKHKTT